MVHSYSARSWEKDVKLTDASLPDFAGWFEREIQLIEAACQSRGVACFRPDRSTMTVGAASINLAQLQRALDHRPTEAMASTVLAWIDKAIAVQDADSPHAPLTAIFPHLRSPKDQAHVPWIRKLADERLLFCLVAEDATSMRYLGPIETTRFGCPQDQVHKRAICNLSLLPPYSLMDCTEEGD